MVMRIWCAVRGEGSKLGNWARTQSTPPVSLFRKIIRQVWGDGVVEGCWEQSRNKGESTVCFYRLYLCWLSEPVDYWLLTAGWLDCLIIRTWSSRNLLIKHRFWIILHCHFPSLHCFGLYMFYWLP